MRQTRAENKLTQWTMAICGARASTDVDNLRETLPAENSSSMSCSSFLISGTKRTCHTLTIHTKGIEITSLLLSELERCGITIATNVITTQEPDCYSQLKFLFLHSREEAEAHVDVTFPNLETDMWWRDWQNFEPFRSSF